MVVAGNLDPKAKPYSKDDSQARSGSTITYKREVAESAFLEEGSPMLGIERMIFDLRTFDAPDTMYNKYHPSQWPLTTSLAGNRPAVNTNERQSCLNQNKTRLRAILACQYRSVSEWKNKNMVLLLNADSFGSHTGAPVLFYVGAFISTLLDSLKDSRNEDVDFVLASRVLWMITPLSVSSRIIEPMLTMLQYRYTIGNSTIANHFCNH